MTRSRDGDRATTSPRVPPCEFMSYRSAFLCPLAWARTSQLARQGTSVSPQLTFSWGSAPFTSALFKGSRRGWQALCSSPSVPKPKGLHWCHVRLSPHLWANADASSFWPRCPQILKSLWCSFFLLAAPLTSLALSVVLPVPFLLSRSISGNLLPLVYAEGMHL